MLFLEHVEMCNEVMYNMSPFQQKKKQKKTDVKIEASVQKYV